MQIPRSFLRFTRAMSVLKSDAPADARSSLREAMPLAQPRLYAALTDAYGGLRQRRFPPLPLATLTLW
ncbi:hypothetical protein GS682_27565 [Nostoc sp. B(2019)]|nr:hypothetical protein [Nostoc sp. B(2019)]